MKKFYLLLFFAFIAYGQLYAQDDDSRSTIIIEKIRELYDLGRMDSIPKYLLGNNPDNFDYHKGSIPDVSKDDEPEAFKFLSLSYIFLDDSEKADAAMLRLLKEDNLFIPNNETDPAELHNLYNQYRTWPIFRLGVFYGVNASFTEVINAYSVSNSNDEIEHGKYYTGFGVVNVGLQLEKDFLKRMITLETDFLYGTVSNFYTQTLGEGRIIRGDATGKTSEYEAEKQSFIGGNVIVQYHPFHKNYNSAKWKPYLMVGGAANFLIRATLNNSTTTKVESGTPPVNDSVLFGTEATDGTANNIVIRNQDNYYLIGGIGVKYQIGPLHLFLNGQYNYGLNNLTIKNTNPSDYGKAYNDIKIHYAQLTFGVALSIYSPKKLIF